VYRALLRVIMAGSGTEWNGMQYRYRCDSQYD